MLEIVDRINKSKSLFVAHLTDNCVPFDVQRQIYEKLGVKKEFQKFHQSLAEQDRTINITDTKQFKQVMKTLMRPDFNIIYQNLDTLSSPEENEQSRTEANKCFMVNCYHMKQLNQNIER